MKTMRKFPGSKQFKVSKKGSITFSNAQFKWLLDFSGCKSKSLVIQRRVVKKLVIDAIKTGLKEAKRLETDANK